jgi:hypothetical protein
VVSGESGRLIGPQCTTHHSTTHSSPAGCPGGVEPATSTFTASHASLLHHGHSASTRIRTWNTKLEAWHDLRFTIEAAEGEGVEPSFSVAENRLSRAARPTVSGCPPNSSPHEWTAGELNPDSLGANQVSSQLDQQPGHWCQPTKKARHLLTPGLKRHPHEEPGVNSAKGTPAVDSPLVWRSYNDNPAQSSNDAAT